MLVKWRLLLVLLPPSRRRCRRRRRCCRRRDAGFKFIEVLTMMISKDSFELLPILT